MLHTLLVGLSLYATNTNLLKCVCQEYSNTEPVRVWPVAVLANYADDFDRDKIQVIGIDLGMV